MEQKFHHIGVCIAFESERVYILGVFVSEREVNAKAFSACKGVVIIIGGGEGVFGLYSIYGSYVSPIQTYRPTYPEIYTHACFLAATPTPRPTKTRKTTILDKPTMLVQ
jgi:hypothetical protein